MRLNFSSSETEIEPDIKGSKEIKEKLGAVQKAIFLALGSRHENGHKFALEAEVEIETEKNFFRDWD